MGSKVRVLLIENSSIVQKAVRESLAAADDINLIGASRDTEGGLEVIRSNPPDVVILDVEVPGSLELVSTIQELNRERSNFEEIGVIVFASRGQRDADVAIQALEAGAFDFVSKPLTSERDELVKALNRQLLVKIRNFSSKRIFSGMYDTALGRKPGRNTTGARRSPADSVRSRRGTIKAIVVGVSTGGPKALATLLPDLSRYSDLPILVVQHMPPKFTSSLAESLDGKCSFDVREALDGEPLLPRTVYIAPGGMQMRVRKSASGARLHVEEGLPGESLKPSVNVLFDSVAEAFGGEVLAIVLTGMGADGTDGLKKLKQAGAYVVVQDKGTSVVWGMPGSAVAAGCVDKILPVDEIAAHVVRVMEGD